MAASGSDELHQALIRDHFRRPRNRGPQDDASGTGRAHNPFCGDTVVVWARVEDDRLARMTFDGRGCAISLAAASMLTVTAVGKTAAEVEDMRRKLVAALAPDGPAMPSELGDLRALAGVRRFPSRIRCAALAFEALEEALRESVS